MCGSLIFDRLVHIAADVFHARFATVTFVGAERQMYFAKTGISIDGTARSESICTHTVERDRPLIIKNMSTDLEWCSRAFPLEGAPLGFYAGAPLHFEGEPVGTFCIMDHQPRPYFDTDDIHLLTSFALIAEDLLMLLRMQREPDRPGLPGAA